MTPKLPPGPKGHPVLGNALAFRRDPLAFLTETARHHGPVARVRLGGTEMYLLSAPDDVERVLLSERDKFRKPRFVSAMGRLLFGRAITAIDGDAWRRQRDAVAPFFQPRNLAALRTSMRVHAEAFAESLRVDRPLRFDVALFDLSLRMLGEVLLGRRLDGTTGSIARAANLAIDGFGARMKLGIATPEWLPLPHNLRLRRGSAAIRRCVAGWIAEDREHAENASLLSLLLRGARSGTSVHGKEELCDELAVMLAVGAHQTSLALAWTLHLLATNPGEAEKLRAALEMARDPIAVPYAAQVVDESLRLHPPFYLIARDARVTCEIGGYETPAGTMVGLSPWVTQRDPKLYDQPDAFVPERWARGAAERLPRFAYFPFGGGPRVCVASALVRDFAMQVLGSVIGRYRVESPAPERVRPAPSVALGFADGLTLVVRR